MRTAGKLLTMLERHDCRVLAEICVKQDGATYAQDLTWNTHCHPAYAAIRDRHCARVGELQHPYRPATGKWTGGGVVSDRQSGRSAAELFRIAERAPVPTALIPAQQHPAAPAASAAPAVSATPAAPAAPAVTDP
ncbi:hypothetical protein [Streptomyces prasinus]|uniref:hypothetical protein n=1 Tax=Streptomyces prasinus TaxID=67345 RepID=UPI0033D83751